MPGDMVSEPLIKPIPKAHHPIMHHPLPMFNGIMGKIKQIGINNHDKSAVFDSTTQSSIFFAKKHEEHQLIIFVKGVF
jgi:hypothetical protein